MKKFFIASSLVLLLGTAVCASVPYSSININPYNLASVIPNSYIRGVIAQGEITRWNPATYPIRVYIQKNGVPPEYVAQLKKAYMKWQTATNGEVKFTLVSSPDEADTKCIFLNDLENMADNALGYHQFRYNGDRIADSTIRFKFTDPYGRKFSPDLLYTVALHEIGHSLGLSGHSSNPKDLMYPVTAPRKADFTQRDLTTFKLLYKMIPDNTNKPFTSAQKSHLMTKAQVVGGEERLNKDAETAARINSNITPNDPTSKLRLANAYKKNGNYAAAIKAYKESAPLVDSTDVKAEIYAEIADCYISQKNYTAAENCINYATKRYSSDRLKAQRAGVMYYKGQKNIAVSELLNLYNNGRNPYAGNMLKEIYESSSTPKQIKSMIEQKLVR